MRDTLMHVRDLRPDPASPAEKEVLPPWLIAAGSGAGAALASATMLVVLTVLGWLTGAGGSESAGATVAAGIAGWAFAHGAPLSLAEGGVGLVPWLLAGWPLLCAWWSAQRIVPDPEERSPRLRGFGGVRRDVALAGGAFVVGYLLAALVLLVGAYFGVAGPSLAATAFGSVALAASAYLLALVPAFRGHRDALAPRVAWAWREYVPTWAARAIRPALTAVLATLGSGLLLLVVAVGVGISPVLEVYSRVGGGAVGATLLTLAQLAYLPTLAMWGASWLAGPGFMLGGGTEVSWAVSEPGILPLIPVLAAVPAPGPMPGWAPLAVIVPVLIGIGLGIACVRLAERTWVGRARLTGVAVVVYGLVILVLSVAASGPVGSGRFAHVGLDAVVTTLALTGEVGLAAFVVVGLAGLRLHRTHPDTAPEPNVRPESASSEDAASTAPDDAASTLKDVPARPGKGASATTAATATNGAPRTAKDGAAVAKKRASAGDAAGRRSTGSTGASRGARSTGSEAPRRAAPSSRSGSGSGRDRTGSTARDAAEAAESKRRPKPKRDDPERRDT